MLLEQTCFTEIPVSFIPPCLTERFSLCWTWWRWTWPTLLSATSGLILCSSLLSMSVASSKSFWTDSLVSDCFCSRLLLFFLLLLFSKHPSLWLRKTHRTPTSANSIQKGRNYRPIFSHYILFRFLFFFGLYMPLNLKWSLCIYLLFYISLKRFQTSKVDSCLTAVPCGCVHDLCSKTFEFWNEF